MAENDASRQAAWRKFASYDLEVDPDQNDKAREIQICSWSRPHMRAFHCAWWGFFMTFFIWFAINPLIPAIQESLSLTKEELWNSSIAGVGGTILIRLIVGPLCDKYGARTSFCLMLCAAAIPTGCTGLVQTAQGLMILRAFIGIGGGTFVTTEYWTGMMFTKEIVGTANGLAAGWGNLGASVTQIVVGSFLFPLFISLYDDDIDKAWRVVSIVPAVVAFVTGVIIYFISDDAPKGNYSELKKHGVMKDVSVVKSFVVASLDFNTWLLFIQYGCCFGVELTMNNAAALYFRDVFGQSAESAGAIASIFGWMNLFARGVGGVISDSLNETMGMRGRILIQFLLLLFEGISILVFAHTDTLAGAIIVLLLFSMFVKSANGTSFAITPYIKPPYTGSVSGFVGAGGNVGAVCFGIGFRNLDYTPAFTIMGWTVIASAFLSIFISIKGHRGLLHGEDLVVDKETGEVVEDVVEGEGLLETSKSNPAVLT